VSSSISRGSVLIVPSPPLGDNRSFVREGASVYRTRASFLLVVALGVSCLSFPHAPARSPPLSARCPCSVSFLEVFFPFSLAGIGFACIVYISPCFPFLFALALRLRPKVFFPCSYASVEALLPGTRAGPPFRASCLSRLVAVRCRSCLAPARLPGWESPPFCHCSVCFCVCFPCLEGFPLIKGCYLRPPFLFALFPVLFMFNCLHASSYIFPPHGSSPRFPPAAGLTWQKPDASPRFFPYILYVALALQAMCERCFQFIV
jgi:hypothetical protein